MNPDQNAQGQNQGHAQNQSNQRLMEAMIRAANQGQNQQGPSQQQQLGHQPGQINPQMQQNLLLQQQLQQMQAQQRQLGQQGPAFPVPQTNRPGSALGLPGLEGQSQLNLNQQAAIQLKPDQVQSSSKHFPSGSSPKNLPGNRPTPTEKAGPGAEPADPLRKKRYKRYDKPPYTYQALIALSIQSAPQKMLRLSQILEQIKKMFPFFQGEYTGWKESVRHNLSQCDAFKQVLRDPNRPQSKGNFWTVNINKIPAEQFRRQNTKVSRAVPPGYGYALDLRDIFDIYTGMIKIAPVNPQLHPLLRPLSECKPQISINPRLTNPLDPSTQSLMTQQLIMQQQRYFQNPMQPNIGQNFQQQLYNQQNLQAAAMQQQLHQQQQLQMLQQQMQQQKGPMPGPSGLNQPQRRSLPLPTVPQAQTSFPQPKTPIKTDQSSPSLKLRNTTNSTSSPTNFLPHSPSSQNINSSPLVDNKNNCSSGHSNKPNIPSSDSNDLNIEIGSQIAQSDGKKSANPADNLLQIQSNESRSQVSYAQIAAEGLQSNSKKSSSNNTNAWQPTTICNMMPETPLIVHVLNTECSSSPNPSPHEEPAGNQPEQKTPPDKKPESEDFMKVSEDRVDKSSDQAADDEESSSEQNRVGRVPLRGKKLMNKKTASQNRKCDWEKRRKVRQKRKLKTKDRESSPPAKQSKKSSTPVAKNQENSGIGGPSSNLDLSKFSLPEISGTSGTADVNTALSTSGLGTSGQANPATGFPSPLFNQNLLTSPQHFQPATDAKNLAALGQLAGIGTSSATSQTTSSQTGSTSFSSVLSPLLDSLLNSPQAIACAAQSPELALKLSLCQQLMQLDKATAKPPPNVLATALPRFELEPKLPDPINTGHGLNLMSTQLPSSITQAMAKVARAQPLKPPNVISFDETNIPAIPNIPVSTIQGLTQNSIQQSVNLQAQVQAQAHNIAAQNQARLAAQNNILNQNLQMQNLLHQAQLQNLAQMQGHPQVPVTTSGINRTSSKDSK